MTKRKDNIQPDKSREVPRRHRSKHQREAQVQRWVLIGVGAAIALVIVLLGYGLVNEYLLKPRQDIASVNGQGISVAQFQRRLRFEQDQLTRQIDQYLQFGQQFAEQGGGNPFLDFVNQLFQDLSTPERFSFGVVEEMIDDALLRQLATENGASISDEELQREIESQFGYDRDAPPPPTPDPSAAITDTVESESNLTLEDFQSNYNEFIASLGENDSLTETEFRQQFGLDLIRSQLQEVAPLEIDTTEEQVNVRHILIRPEQPEPVVPAKVEADALGKIQEAQRRIEAGEAFADVAAEVSEDPGSAQQGGDLGFFGRGMMVPEFEEAAFALQPGEMSDPIKTQFGYHLILVEEVDEENEQVRARHILARTEASPDEEAIAAAEAAARDRVVEARDRILAGEAFEDVAKEMSDDAATAEAGGEIGWFWRGESGYGEAFEEAAFSLEPGVVSEPIETDAGYHLVLVIEKDEERPVDEVELDRRRSDAFDQWFQAQREAATIENKWSLEFVPELPSDLQDYVDQLRVYLLQQSGGDGATGAP